MSEVRSHRGQASVLELSTRDKAQKAEFTGLTGLEETEARKRWRGIAEALQSLRRIDHYPGAAAEQARAELDALRQALDARFSRGEPVAQAPHGIPRLDRRKFRGKRWATRARPWVDRLACTWLIRRFIDADPRLQRIARAVHFLDVGGIPVPEAAVFRALYAAPGTPT